MIISVKAGLHVDSADRVRCRFKVSSSLQVSRQTPSHRPCAVAVGDFSP